MKNKVFGYLWKIFFTLSTVLYFLSDNISSSFAWDRQIVPVDGSSHTTGGFNFLPTYLEFVVFKNNSLRNAETFSIILLVVILLVLAFACVLVWRNKHKLALIPALSVVVFQLSFFILNAFEVFAYYRERHITVTFISAIAYVIIAYSGALFFSEKEK